MTHIINFLLTNLLLTIFGLGAFAASVDTVSTHSKAMDKTIKAVVITPSNYELTDSVQVIYLLHGYGGDYANWIKRVPELTTLADQYQVMIVCPDGGHGSWYWDSPVNTAYRYETYVAKELVDWIDQSYKTYKSRNGRAITGLSMGGHGALFLAMRHQDRFGAAGSTAGGVDIRPFALRWDVKQYLGDYADHPKRWDDHTVMGMLHLLKPEGLAMIVDCGKDDFFFPINQQLHQALLERNIPHTYLSMPGAHNWDYWKVSIRYHFLFFDAWFKQQQTAG